jgi:SOS-response transcriptional repressor LexA
LQIFKNLVYIKIEEKMEKEKISFGGTLLALRKRLGITQKELGKRAGVIFTSISDYEHNKTTPERETLEKLANALQVSFDELIEMAVHHEREQEAIQEMLNELEIKKIANEISKQLKDSILVPIPVLEQVPVGKPTPKELEEQSTDKMRLPQEMADNANYILRLKGMSMIDEGIRERDLLLIRIQSVAQDGDIVIARLKNEEYVIKRYKESGQERWLEPSDSQLKSLKESFEVVGIVTYVIRKYK